MKNQSSRDEILQILSNYGRSMKKSELRRHTGLRMYEISSILEDLEKEGKIRIEKDIVSLI